MMLRLEYIDASELQDNDFNWRTHPQKQLDALGGMIEEVGWAGALLFNERTGRLIDGHARKRIAKGKVPVLIGSWTEEQEKKILATLDPLAAMAEVNAEQLEKLLSEIESNCEAMNSMLDDLAQDAGITPPDFAPVSADEQGRLDEKAKVKCPKCGEEFTP